MKSKQRMIYIIKRKSTQSEIKHSASVALVFTETQHSERNVFPFQNENTISCGFTGF